MIVSSQLFEDYIECATKCWLRSRAEPAAGNVYAEWARAQNEAYRQDALKKLLAVLPEGDRVIRPPISKSSKDATWRIAIDVPLRTNELESRLHAVERIASEGRGSTTQFIPYRFEFTNKLTRQQKLLVAFDMLVLSEAVGRAVILGKIMHGDSRATLKVKISAFASEVRKRIKEITALLAGSPPDLVLNRHCGQCEFKARCSTQAREKDELSLLSGISEKERRKLHGKGIFTVTQLSYTFRPRRRRQELQGKQEKLHHSLRALAIRENKIHTVDLPDPKLDGTLVYLDVEGLPDRDFYYLIGIRVGSGDDALQYGLWANDERGEQRIWREFLGILSAIPDPRLVHYGSYESTFLKRMHQRYGGPCEGSAAAAAIKDAVNVLSYVFARIYFPTFSYGLKEVGRYLGFCWSDSPASGLEAIVWRHRWEASNNPGIKEALLHYNREDCEALELVTKRLINLHRAAPTDSQWSHNDVIRTSDMKWESPYGFKRNEFVFSEMETINKAAYWDYQRERIYVKSHRKSTRKRKRHSSPARMLKPNSTIEYPRPSSCPTCESKLVYRHGRRTKTVVDLKFMRYGIKRWVTHHVAQQYRCPSCKSTFYPPDRRWSAKKYGEALIAYVIYQTIDLRFPQSRVAAVMNQLFGLCISRQTTNRFKTDMAQTYRCTYDNLLKRLCKGRLLHVDETSISVMGKNSYVWVLTSMEEVVYFHTPTREGSTIQAMLKNFSGVLVIGFLRRV